MQICCSIEIKIKIKSIHLVQRLSMWHKAFSDLQIDRWIGRRTDGRTFRRTFRRHMIDQNDNHQLDRQMTRRADGQTDGRTTNRQTERGTLNFDRAILAYIPWAVDVVIRIIQETIIEIQILR